MNESISRARLFSAFVTLTLLFTSHSLFAAEELNDHHVPDVSEAVKQRAQQFLNMELYVYETTIKARLLFATGC